MATTRGDDQPSPAVLSRLRMPGAVLEALACPHCAQGLAPGSDALVCGAGHSFDVAREGYASLLGGRRPADAGDSAPMVRARTEFQQAGHYAPIADRLARLVAQAAPDAHLVADIGAGTGYYLCRVLDELPRALGLAADVSKFAVRRAAKAHPRAGAVTCDAWQGLPLRPGSVSVLLNVFAPRNGAEFGRVLHREGVLAVLTPAADHLAELRAPLGLLEVDPRKDERLDRGLRPHLEPVHQEEVHTPLVLERAQAAALVAMGPSARHIDPRELERRTAALPGRTEATAAVRLRLYRPVPRPD